jgi:hypothetical protein
MPFIGALGAFLQGTRLPYLPRDKTMPSFEHLRSNLGTTNNDFRGTSEENPKRAITLAYFVSFQESSGMKQYQPLPLWFQVLG